MRAAYFSGPGQIEIRDVNRPTLSPDGAEDVLVKVSACGICGSDLHVYHARFPAAPVCPGHEISGEVVEVGAAVRRVHPGDRVAVEPLVVCHLCPQCRRGDYQLCRHFRLLGTILDGGFAEYVRAPASALFVLPDSLDYELGALAEPMAVAVHGIRLGQVRIGDRVAVLGAGTIGLLGVAAARAAGAMEVWVTARHAQQRAAAIDLGATRVFSGAEAGAEIAAAAAEAAVDVVVETVGGVADTINEALHLVRPGGWISILGVFTASSQINALLLIAKEVRMVGALTYGRFGARADFDVALQLLTANPEMYRRLITHRFPLDEIVHGFEAASDKRSGAIKVSIRPN